MQGRVLMGAPLFQLPGDLPIERCDVVIHVVPDPCLLSAPLSLRVRYPR